MRYMCIRKCCSGGRGTCAAAFAVVDRVHLIRQVKDGAGTQISFKKRCEGITACQGDWTNPPIPPHPTPPTPMSNDLGVALYTRGQ